MRKNFLCSFVLFLAKKKEQTNQKRKKYADESDTKRSNFASGNLGIDKQTSRSSKRKVSLSRGLKDLIFVPKGKYVAL